MASYVDLMFIANYVAFQNRVKYAFQLAAINVMAEDPQTPNHAERVTFADRVLSGLVAIFELAVGILTNPSIAAEADVELYVNASFGIPDGDIQFTANSMFNAFAGIG